MHISTPVGATDNQFDLCRLVQVCAGVYTKPVLVLHIYIHVQITFLGIIIYIVK